MLCQPACSMPCCATVTWAVQESTPVYVFVISYCHAVDLLFSDCLRWLAWKDYFNNSGKLKHIKSLKHCSLDWLQWAKAVPKWHVNYLWVYNLPGVDGWSIIWKCDHGCYRVYIFHVHVPSNWLKKKINYPKVLRCPKYLFSFLQLHEPSLWFDFRKIVLMFEIRFPQMDNVSPKKESCDLLVFQEKSARMWPLFGVLTEKYAWSEEDAKEVSMTRGFLLPDKRKWKM